MTGREALLDLLAAPDGALALVEPASGERTTYGELRATAERLASSLAAAGVGPGDAVAMSLPNGPEIVAAFLGVVAAGAAARAAQPGLHRRRVPRLPRRPAAARDALPARRGEPGARGLRRARRPPARAQRARRTAELALADIAAAGSTPRRAIPRPSRCCCTRAARRASPRACRSGSATWRPPRARSPRPTALSGERRESLRDAALPRPRARRLDARDARLGRHA